MSTPLNHPHVSVIASLMKLHFEELDPFPEQLLLKREEMIPILEKCLSHFCLKEGPGVGMAAEKSNTTDQINPNYAPGGPIDSAFLKDCAAQSRVATNKSFIKIVHGYLVEAGKEKEAEGYLKKVAPASLVQNFESIKMWNLLTLPFKVLQGMEDMGLGHNPLRLEPPPHLFPTPTSGWKPGQATAHCSNPGPCFAGLNERFATYAAGIVPEMEDRTSTAVEDEPNPPAELVLHVGDVTAQSAMDAAPEDSKKKGVMEVGDTD